MHWSWEADSIRLRWCDQIQETLEGRSTLRCDVLQKTVIGGSNDALNLMRQAVELGGGQRGTQGPWVHSRAA